MAHLKNTIIDGILRVNGDTNIGGTLTVGLLKGTIEGTAESAVKLTTARTIQTDLASEASVKFDGSQDVQPGVTGILPVTHGGTGASTVAGILTNIGINASVKELNYVKGVTESIQTQLNNKASIDKMDTTLRDAKDYTDQKIEELVGTSPDALNTLEEIAKALDNRADIVDVLEEAINKKADQDSLTGHVNNKDNPHGTNLSHLGVTVTADKINFLSNVTSDVQTQLNNKAASNHGTHVTFSTDKPKPNASTASAGGSSTTTVAKSDHVHPLQTSVSGNAGSATKLASKVKLRTNLSSNTIVEFDGSETEAVTPGVTGTLPIGYGGTGGTTALAAEYNILGSMAEASTAVNDDTLIVFKVSSPSATNGATRYRKVSALWSYLETKVDNKIDSAITTTLNTEV